MAEKRLTGYRRADGRVGIRNHVLIVPVDDLSNAVAESVAKAIPGTLALPHPYGVSTQPSDRAGQPAGEQDQAEDRKRDPQ